jgi:hypothetical protein
MQTKCEQESFKSKRLYLRKHFINYQQRNHIVKIKINEEIIKFIVATLYFFAYWLVDGVLINNYTIKK